MSTPLVTINLVVLNGKKYVRHCLKAVQEQTYRNLEINIFDNSSTDGTKEIVREEFPQFNLIESTKNLGTWPGQEKAIESSRGKYIVALSVDVLMHPTAIEKAVEILEKDEKIGALQAKIYQYNISEFNQGSTRHFLQKVPGRTFPKIIDTLGFQIFRSRRITNLGHGEEDHGQHDQEKEIFAVEGAAPIFKKRLDWRNKRLARIKNDYCQNMFSDFLPIGWREIRELGYIILFEPTVLLEIPKLIKLLPRTLKKRRAILARAQVGPKEMARWFK